MRIFLTFCVTFLLTSFLAIFSSYTAEVTDVFQFQERNLAFSFNAEGDDILMTWSALPYPCTYEIETLNLTTGIVNNSPQYHLLTSAQVGEAKYIVPRAPIQTFYKVTAKGLFGEIFQTKTFPKNPNFPFPTCPVTIFHYSADKPASLMPFLVWHTVPHAVCYEVEILSAPPEVEGGISLSQIYSLESTRRIYTNGWQADLRAYKNYPELYWRVRALDLHLNPIGEFCKAEKIYLDEFKLAPNCPLINNFDFMDYIPLPIYPVYSWIPLNNAYKYEVELLTHPPKVENNIEPSEDSLWRQTTQDKSSCYDEYSRPYAGPYYWRVRALDEFDNPIGTWSDSEKFVVPDYTQGVFAAIFGDSISHDGGAVSYSPRSLEYSYATYIDFPVINLSRSGDTSHMTLERFSKDVLPFKPKNLIISTGANSLRATNISAEEIISDLREIGNLCVQNNIRPIYLTLMPINPANISYAFHTPTDPEWHDKLNQVNAFIKRQKYFIDLEPYFYDSFGTMDVQFSVDGLHPDLRGKMLIGEIINQHKDLFEQ